MLSAMILAMAVCIVPLIMASGYLLMGVLGLFFIAALVVFGIRGIAQVFEEKTFRNHHVDLTADNVLYLPARSSNADQEDVSKKREQQAV